MLDKNRKLSRTATKIDLKLRNNLNVDKDCTDYMITLLSSVTEEDADEFLEYKRKAEAFIKSHSVQLSEIPTARINQYVDLLNDISDEMLEKEATWDVLLHISAELYKALDAINPDWRKAWNPEYFLHESEPTSSVSVYIKEYRHRLDLIKKSEIGSREWICNIAEMGQLCFDSGFLEENEKGRR